MSKIQVETYTTHVKKGPPNYSAAVKAGVIAEPTGVGDELRLNASYIRSIPGIIQIIEALIGLICLISISPPRTWYSIVFTFVVAIAFAVTVTSFFCILVTMRNVIFPKFNWKLAELIYTSATAVLYLTTAIIHLILSTRQLDKYYLQKREFFDGYIVAGVFGLFNAIVYAVGAYFLIKQQKQEENSRVDNNP